ncbi:MAG: hypothetical protein GY707_19195 [Desulfobacteraceae bacterium]|nr:hypothetical protein [Desulfobacteraceae bacterium]
MVWWSIKSQAVLAKAGCIVCGFRVMEIREGKKMDHYFFINGIKDKKGLEGEAFKPLFYKWLGD